MTTTTTTKKSSNNLIIMLAIIGGAVVCACGILLLSGLIFNSGGEPKEPVPWGNKTLSYYMCQDFIEKRLTAPATVKWPSTSDIQILGITNKPNSYQVKGYFDAENSFGALIRTGYICEITDMGNNQWQLDYLKFDE